MKKFFKNFGAFIARGNIIDLAVAVIIGAAFNAIISGLVNYILMPIITMAVPGGMAGLVTVLPSSKLADIQNGTVGALHNGKYYITYSAIEWGLWLNTVINFVLVALVLFIIIKIIMSVKAAKERLQKQSAPTPAVAAVPADVQLLTEIRDLLKKDQVK
ncbi:MAG: large conductance mechanosensitive channel protein MscL [Erysipelotrichaceae bacterium]|jgi:large conductance mechanosensitive channel|nr:large conductance mechanosensitive channel protein MscL [Erysipelotrichaceae bacterium]